MEHRLVKGIEAALGWNGPGLLGGAFARGSISDPGLIERIFTTNKLLDTVMRRSVTVPQLRCFRGGEELHPNAFVSAEVNRRGQSIPMANMLRLGALLREGCTLVLDEANVFDPAMEVACRALQWWSRERVQVNMYLTTQDASGFDLHWDDHDVVVVQLEGEKAWEVRGVSRPAPMYRDAARNDDPSEQIVWSGVMRAGDVMHIPRGYWHQATRNGKGGGQSLHMTFGFTKRTGVSWLTWLADWSREHELFRHDLDRWGTAEQREMQADQLRQAAQALIAARPVGGFLTTRELDEPAARHVPFLEIFGPLREVVCVTQFPPLIDEHGESVEVLAAGTKLTFAAKTLPALRLLLSGRPVMLADAALSVGAEVERMAEILIEEGLCASVTVELSSGYTGLVANAAC